jgi:hypothetical protein
VAVLFCWFAIVLLLACAVFHFMRKRSLACWLLVLFPATLCARLLLDLARGAEKLGPASYHSDLRVLPFLLVLLAITVFAALRPKWRWLFWITWLISAPICAGIAFLTFFLKVGG